MFTFSRGSFYASLGRDDEVTDAVAYAELSIELAESPFVLKSFPDSIEIQVDVYDFDGESDYDGFEFSSITGSIANIEMDDRDINEIVKYCESRKLILDIDETEGLYCSDFIEKFNKKPITKLLIDSYFKYLTDGDIEIEEVETFVLTVVSTNKPLKKFSDSTYGNLEGKTVDKDIDMSGYNLKSLKGSPKIVDGDFNIKGNDLSDFKYGPESVYSLQADNISNLQYLPHIKNINKSSIQLAYSKDRKLLEEELKYRLNKNNTYGISSNDIRIQIFEETGNTMFLSDEAKDIFVF